MAEYSRLYGKYVERDDDESAGDRTHPDMRLQMVSELTRSNIPVMSKKNCLIVVEDARVGDQLVSLLTSQYPGWRIHVVQSDRMAYERLMAAVPDVIIADIDAVNLGGLALLAYCHHRDPSIATYAIAPANDGYRKKLARDLAGCRGFFYLLSEQLMIDSERGMGAVLAANY